MKVITTGTILLYASRLSPIPRRLLVYSDNMNIVNIIEIRSYYNSQKVRAPGSCKELT